MAEKKIEKLETEVSKIQKSLEELKTATLSDAEKTAKEKEIKSKAEATKNEIQGRIDKLTGKTDAKSLAEKEKAEALLATLTEVISLQLSIGQRANTPEKKEGLQVKSPSTRNPTETTTATTESQTEDKKKGFLGKTGEWIGEQWSDVRDKEKREKEGGKNLLRTAGFVATGVGAIALATKGIKKLFGKDKKKESDSSESKDRGINKGFREKPIGKTIKGIGIAAGIGSGVYYIAHGLYTKNRSLIDMFDWEKGKKLNFDEAMQYSEGAIQNQADDKSMSYGINLKYHEDSSEIEAYGERIKIDKNARKIKGLSISFKKYEHMINTAIVIAFLKKNYAGRCSNDSPFDFSGSWRGNVNVNTSGGNKIALDGSGNGGKILGVGAAAIASIAAAIRGGGLKTGATVLTVGGILGLAGGAAYDADNIMNNLMPELDNEYGKKSLSAYLNSMGGWEAGNQSNDTITSSPIRDNIIHVKDEIENTGIEDNKTPRGNFRKLDAIQDVNDPTKYTFTAYNSKIRAEVLGEGNNKTLRILGLSDSGEEIQIDTEKCQDFLNIKLPLNEGIHMISLIGYFLGELKHKGYKYPSFYYGKRLGLVKRGLYFNDKRNTYALTEKNFNKNMPELFKEKEKFMRFLNDGLKTKNTGISIWRAPNSYKK